MTTITGYDCNDTQRAQEENAARQYMDQLSDGNVWHCPCGCINPEDMDLCEQCESTPDNYNA